MKKKWTVYFHENRTFQIFLPFPWNTLIMTHNLWEFLKWFKFNPSAPLSSLNLDLSFGGSSGFGKPAAISAAPMTGLTGMTSSSGPTGGLQNQSFQRKHDWTVQPAQKLKYNQQFNQADRNKSGFLEGVVARRWDLDPFRELKITEKISNLNVRNPGV